MGEFSDYGTGDLALGLLSRDATRVQPLGGQLLAILLNAMVTKGLVVTLVLDCCFAASIYRLERKNVRFLPFDAATFVMDHDEPTETIAQASSSCRDLSMQPSWLIDPNSYAILAACGPHEEATEVILGGVEHGALSFFLARSLRDFGMNKRHRDVFYRISPSFKANKLDQTPALYGNKNQEFFGPHTLATTRSVIPAYKSRQETFTLEAGQAHGFRGGDDFILYPSGVVDGSAALHNNVIAARISNLGPLTSVLGLTDGGKITETKCVAEPQSRQCFHDFPITLSDEVPKPEEWIAAFQSYSLAVYRASEGHPAWLNLQVIGDEYKIYSKHVRYEFVKTLKNDSVPARFRSLFEVSIKTRADDIFTPDNIVDVEEDTRNKYMFELIVQNKCPEELYLHIFNLGPFWQVENVFYGTAVLPPQTFEDQFTGKFSKKMRTMVPKEMRAMGSRQCEDILKVIVTSHPTSFDMLELPKIGGSPKKPVVDEHRTTIKEAPGWMAFNFPPSSESSTNLQKDPDRNSHGESGRIRPSPLCTQGSAKTVTAWLRQKSERDLVESVLVARDSIDATKDGHPDLPLFWANLGTLLIDRYYVKGLKRDLDEAVDCTRGALKGMDKRNPLRATLLDKLGVTLGHLHWRGGPGPKVQGYLEEAISNLGTHLGHKYHLAKTNSGLQECIKCHVAALRAEQSPTLRRIQAADDVLPYCADLKDWNLAFDVATSAVSLFPKLIFRSHQHSDKLHMLGKVSGLASDAAAMALNAGKGLDVVLTILERGRGLLSQSMEEMRTDRASLKAQHPQYAEELDRVRGALDFPLQANDSLEDPEETWEAESILRKKADKMLDDLLTKIRKKPGFEDYLLPPSETAMRAAAQKGPIVVINVSQYRCDAIIVKPDRLHLLPLPKLTLSAVEDAYMAESSLPSAQPSGPLPQGPVSNSNYNIWEAFVSNMGWDGPLTNPASSGLSRKPSKALGSPKVLRWLWETTAKPVLDYLGYKAIPKDSKWPHLWWIPTGSLSRFAIHAAGDYYPGISETVLDRTVSCYSSSIKSIIQSRRRRIAVHKSPYALLVAMETTKGCSSALPFASKEVSLVSNICRSMSLRPL
ncbi:hypothetical protein FG05_11998 [Fusarium graminearum]|nr:hypothetical protein FG05_11998 [Fusarium graminearum]